MSESDTGPKPPPAVRASYHHGDLRSALLDAGEEVLQERGLQGFTLRECARRAGVSHAAPRHHFADVSGFLTAIAARGFDRLADCIRDRLAAVELTPDTDEAENLVEQFHATTCGYLEFALAWPEHFRIMFRHDLVRADDPDLSASANNTFRELTNVVLRQRGEPELPAGARPPNPAAADAARMAGDSLDDDIVIAWSHVHGIAHLRLEQQLQMDDAELETKAVRRAAQRLSDLLGGR